jgi:hypothetical protein
MANGNEIKSAIVVGTEKSRDSQKGSSKDTQQQILYGK